MKSILIGFDAFDPKIFEKLLAKNELPHLAKFIAKGTYRPLAISNPAQSEVSWTSISTGLNPGGHGLFDFVHRNPSNYQLQLSLLPTSKSLVGTQFTQPHEARTFFDQAVEDGYPAASLWWPATFPARQASPVQSIPGLGTPDILGQLGVGSFFTMEKGLDQSNFKSRLDLLHQEGNEKFKGTLLGPGKMKGKYFQHAELKFSLELGNEDRAILTIGGEKIEFPIGEWSPIFEVPFKFGRFSRISGITRAIVADDSNPQIYFLPLQIHPHKSPWPYATPNSLIKQSWKEAGPFLTLGWPQDTTALDENIISDQQFLALCDEIIASRERVFMGQLECFDEGILAIVFDTLDRVQHMFFNRDPEIIEDWYKKIDQLFGRIIKAIKSTGNEDARILVASDHGFAPFDHKVHLNRWLLEKSWLSSAESQVQKNLNPVNWGKSKAYALGLNSLYINLQGREGQGLISEGEYERSRRVLREDLLQWKGPDGRKVMEDVWFREDVFEGQHLQQAPDLVLGYSLGYRASAETGIGGFGPELIEKNTDKWNADHCINPASVPGVLMGNLDLGDLQHPSYKEIPEMMLQKEFLSEGSTPREGLSDEDQKLIEERMKGLGYL